MAISKSIRLLVVEDCMDEEDALQAALNEIIETPNWPNWYACEIRLAANLADALSALAGSRFEAILLNLSLPGETTPLSAFAQVYAAAGSTPVLILADSEDETLAHIVLRSGAQDFLLKPAIDSTQLSRAIRFGIERERRARELESGSFFDPLTGLCNSRGFAAFTSHGMRLARRAGYPLLICVLELPGLDARERELLQIRAADLLRSCFDETTILARIGHDRFGICAFELTEMGVELVLDRFERDFGRTIRFGAATYSSGHPGGFPELVEEAASRLAEKPAMLAH